MAKAYSIDLKEKVINFVSRGGRKREAAKVFGIGENTVYVWLRQHAAGSLAPKRRTEFPRRVPLEAVAEHVKKHPDHTLAEIGRAVGLSGNCVWRSLKTLGITLKKRPFSSVSVMKRSGSSSEKR